MIKMYEMTTTTGSSVILNPAHFVQIAPMGDHVIVIDVAGRSHPIVMESFVEMIRAAKIELFTYAPQTATSDEVKFEDLPDNDVEDLVD